MLRRPKVLEAADNLSGRVLGISPRDQYHRSIERALDLFPADAQHCLQLRTAVWGGETVAEEHRQDRVDSFERMADQWDTQLYAGLPIVVTLQTPSIFSDIQSEYRSGVPQILNHTSRTALAASFPEPGSLCRTGAVHIGNAPQTLDVRGLGSMKEDLSIMKAHPFCPEPRISQPRSSAGNV